MDVELVEGPVVVGEYLQLVVRVEHDGAYENFLVTILALGLYEFAPYNPEVQKAIKRILVETEPQQRAMFEAMARTHST